MNDEQLTAIRERCEAATPGPWNYSEAVEWRRGAGPFDDRGADIISFSDVEVVVGGLQDEQGGAVGVLRNTDAIFIAHAREDVPALLDEVARLRAENERLQAKVRELESTLHPTPNDLAANYISKWLDGDA